MLHLLSQWVPTGIYHLKGSYRHLCCIYSRLAKARLVPFASLRGRIYFFNVMFFYNLTVQAWLGCHQPNRVRGT